MVSIRKQKPSDFTEDSRFRGSVAITVWFVVITLRRDDVRCNRELPFLLDSPRTEYW